MKLKAYNEHVMKYSSCDLLLIIIIGRFRMPSQIPSFPCGDATDATGSAHWGRKQNLCAYIL